MRPHGQIAPYRPPARRAAKAICLKGVKLKNPIAIYTADSNADAHITSLYLKGAGINAFVAEDNSPGGAGKHSPFSKRSGFQRAQLYVEKTDAEAALRLLKEFEAKKQESKADLKEKEPKTIEVVCEECGKKSYFAGSLNGTCQNCPHCDQFVDVGEFEWIHDLGSKDKDIKDDGWIGIPVILTPDEFLSIEEHFLRFGIDYSSETVETESGDVDGGLHHSLFVPEEQAAAAAIVIRNALDIEDPATERPFQGNCPACCEPVFGAWECPSCEIGFRGEFEETDEIIEFIRQYGGFEKS